MSPARNLVPRPAFRAGDPSVFTPWLGRGMGVADRTDSPTGSRMAWAGGDARVPLGVTYEPGMTVYVAADMWVHNAIYEAYLGPEGGEYGDTPARVELKQPSGYGGTYHKFEATITAGPLSEFTDTHGGPIDPPSGAEAYLYLRPMQTNGALSTIRVDLSPTDLPGYFDGDTPDSSEWTYSWDGPARESRSTALPVAVEPDPEDPDPEDPDPEDPDPEDPDPEDPEDPTDPEEPVDPTDPDPWDEWDELTTRLAPRVAAFVGHPGNAELTATAAAQLPVVAEYVRGFTRGRGFTGEAPSGPLRAVIVSGAARLATNPEQVSVFTTGDYSERPAQLAGWTLAELGVLRRYRRVTA